MSPARRRLPFDAEAKAVRALLAPAFKDMEDDEGVSGRAHQDSDVTAAVFQRLLKLKDHEVARIGAFVMAETLASGSAVTDAFGAHAKVSARDHWTPDADLLRSIAGPRLRSARCWRRSRARRPQTGWYPPS